VAPTKSELRRRIRAARAARVPTGEPEQLLAVLRATGLLDPRGRPGRVGAVTITAYIASPGEPDTAAVRAAVRAAGGRVLLPVPLPGRGLGWVLDEGRYAPDPTLPVQVPVGPELGRGAAGLVDQDITLVLAPALAVDRSGARLGQGGGFYDALLAQLAPSAGVARPAPAGGASGDPDRPITVLAVVHDDEVLAPGTIPRGAHDVPVGTALTPGGIVRLGLA
jgi:5-formyltetrahydrofolate cyclo-ligase